MRTFKKIFIVLILWIISSIYCSGSATFRYLPDDSVKVIEKVYLHTDRDSYYSGDDIWFKVYLVDATDRLLTSHSSNLHIELISPASKIIDSRIVRIDEGLGHGDFHLPDSINTAKYVLKAYTNYMRNFSDQIFFEKVITIINPKSTKIIASVSSSYVKDSLALSFYPEGGSLVDSVDSDVAFRAENSYGKGCDVRGIIYSSAGDTVARIKSTHNGMGMFTFIPVSGQKYYVIAQDTAGNKYRAEVLKSFPEGVVMNITGNEEHKVTMKIKTNSSSFPDFRDHDLILTVSARNQLFKTYSFRMKTMNNTFTLPTDDLPDGIITLTLSAAEGKPLCERLVFIQNRNDVKLNVETADNNYKQRDSVSVKITLEGDTARSEEAFLSLSATRDIADEHSKLYPTTISSWFFLESDVKGPVEEPSYYFDPGNNNRLNDLDLLLLTQGWRDFRWKYETMRYQPEDGFTISGKVRRKLFNVPIGNSAVDIGIFKTGKPLISMVPTDSLGRFLVRGVDFTGKIRLIASVMDSKSKRYGWLQLDSVKYNPAPVSMAETGIRNIISGGNKIAGIENEELLSGKKLTRYIQYAEIKYSMQKKYRLSDTIMPGEVSINAKRTIAVESARARNQRYLGTLTPDVEYSINHKTEVYKTVGQILDAKFHLNMMSVTQQINKMMAPIRMLNQNSDDTNKNARGIKVKYESGPKYATRIYLLNGVETTYDEILSLPVDWVDRIDAINSGSYNTATWGERGSEGVISVITNGDIPEKNVYYSVNVIIAGYNEPRIFYSPKHNTTLGKDYKPDLRTTLFWAPEIRIDNKKSATLNYYNADNPAKVVIVAEGITSGGIPVTGKTEYVVR